jgi:tetratricopeptide (TPR) repeat protein
MAEDQYGEVPVHQEVSSDRDASVAGRDLHDHHVEISAPGAQGVLVGKNGTQVNIFVGQDLAEASAVPVDAGQVTALPVVVPTGLLPSIVRGRNAEMALLRQLLRRPREGFVVLAGMGGVGKSTIASAFAESVMRTRGRWRHTEVWFASANDSSSLAGALATVARNLAAAQTDVEAIGTGKSDAADRLWRLLQNSRQKWLLIFDNADDPSVLARPIPVMITSGSSSGAGAGTPADGTGWLRPTKRGLVVVTSRVGDPASWGRHARIVPVGPLEDADATQVLLDRAPHAGDGMQARALARRLGGLPLALRTAGSYLGSDAASLTSFRDYEMELDHPQQASRMLTRAPELHASASAREMPIRTFEISLDDLSRRGVPQARLLLRLLSCYASPTPIPRSLLKAESLRGILAPGREADVQHELDHGLQQLKHLSLIEFNSAESSRARLRNVVVHPVIAAASRAHLRADDDPLAEAPLIRRLSVDLLASTLGLLNADQPADWPAFIVYGPHVHALFQTVADQLDIGHLCDLIWTAATTAWAHQSYGSVAEARRLAAAALSKLHRLPNDDLASLKVQHHLAWFLVLMRQPQEAESIYRTVLAGREQMLGPDDPDTLWTRHELAWVAACQDRWAEAETAYREVLDARLRTLGDDHPDTLMTRHELAWAIANQGQGQEAEQILTAVLDARRRDLGDEHARTLSTRHELAWAIASQGRWAEAEAAYREVLDARRRLLRASHPDILTTTVELAWTIVSQGRNEAALQLYQEVLDARRVILGEEDPDTVATTRAIDRLMHGEITVPRHLA